MNVKYGLFTAVLLLAAGIDGKRKQIPVWLLTGFCSMGAWFFMASLFPLLSGAASGESVVFSALLWRAAAFLPGLLSLFFTHVSRGAVGAGDGWFFLGAACYLSGKEVWSLWMGALLCSSLWGLCLLAWAQGKGQSVRKRRMAFLPFLVPVWIGMKLL